MTDTQALTKGAPISPAPNTLNTQEPMAKEPRAVGDESGGLCAASMLPAGDQCLCDVGCKCCGAEAKLGTEACDQEQAARCAEGVPGCLEWYSGEPRVKNTASNDFRLPREHWEAVTKWTTKLAAMDSELRRWRATAKQLSLSSTREEPPTPETFFVSQIAAITRLLDRSWALAQRNGALRDFLRRVLDKAQGEVKPTYQHEALCDRAQEYITGGPVCGYCGKPGPDGPRSPGLFNQNEIVCSGYAHTKCEEQAAQRNFLKLSLAARADLIKSL